MAKVNLPKNPTGVRKTVKHQDIVRERIQVSAIVTRLQKHVAGKLEMSQTQIRAAEILLKKKLPDLASIEHTGEIVNRTAPEMTDAELASIAAAGSTGAADEAAGEADASSLH